MPRPENVFKYAGDRRTWGYQGQGATMKGTGRRSAAEKWEKGVSGKTNCFVNFPQEPKEDLVSIIL